VSSGGRMNSRFLPVIELEVGMGYILRIFKPGW
jgi:hypothetical protein